jgi:hypothetical protein
MPTIIKALYGPILHPVNAANFTDEDGDIYRLHGAPKFTEKLGKKVLILDIDSRPLTGEGQLMNTELKWKGMRPLSAGMLSHYMFGMSLHASPMSEMVKKEDRLINWQHKFMATIINLSARPTMPIAGVPGSRCP